VGAVGVAGGGGWQLALLNPLSSTLLLNEFRKTNCGDVNAEKIRREKVLPINQFTSEFCRVGRLAFLRTNNLILASFFLAWPRKFGVLASFWPLHCLQEFCENFEIKH
jgi:hypothetical protein